MNLKKIIQKTDLDKKEHSLIGVYYSMLIPFFAFLGFLVNYFFIDKNLILSIFLGATLGFSIGTFLNLYKEIIVDYYKKQGNHEFMDFVYTQIPLILVYTPFFTLFIK